MNASTLSSDPTGGAILVALLIVFCIVLAFLWIVLPFIVIRLRRDTARLADSNEAILAVLRRQTDGSLMRK